MNINNMSVKSPIRWFGGKSYLAKQIVAKFPQQFHCYVEVFGGGASVLCEKKQHSPVEIYNDIDADLINFLMVLRERKQDLIHALSTLPTSRFLFNTWQNESLPKDPFNKALRWFYLLRHTLFPANNMKSGFRCGKIKSVAFDYKNAVQRLDLFERRFNNVNIECLSFEKLIERFDSKTSFFFLDPPYASKEHYYAGGFDRDSHIKLSQILKNIQGKALVTYYPVPFIEDLYKDWHVERINSLVGAIKKKELGEKKREAVELIIRNYEDEPGLSLF